MRQNLTTSERVIGARPWSELAALRAAEDAHASALAQRDEARRDRRLGIATGHHVFRAEIAERAARERVAAARAAVAAKEASPAAYEPA